MVIGWFAVLVSTLVLEPGAGFAGPSQNLKYRFTMTSPVKSGYLRFEDEFVKVSFNLDKTKIAVSLRNTTDKPIKINWDGASYIDPTGESHKCLHLQSTTIVPPGAKIKGLIVPTDCIYFQNTGGNTLKHREREFLPTASKQEAEAYKGKFLSIFLPVEENGLVKNYLFIFRINIVWE
jgi:hypothetical protein